MVVDFASHQKDQADDSLKQYYNELADMIEEMKGLLSKSAKTESLLMLLISAKQQLKSYIDTPVKVEEQIMTKGPLQEIEKAMQEFANGAGDFSGMAPEKLIDISDKDKEGLGSGRDDFDVIIKKAIDNPGYLPESTIKKKVKEAIDFGDNLLVTPQDYHQFLDNIAMESDTMWVGQDDYTDVVMDQLQREGLAEWEEVGYGEAQPTLTPAGIAKYKGSKVPESQKKSLNKLDESKADLARDYFALNEEPYSYRAYRDYVSTNLELPSEVLPRSYFGVLLKKHNNTNTTASQKDPRVVDYASIVNNVKARQSPEEAQMDKFLVKRPTGSFHDLQKFASKNGVSFEKTPKLYKAFMAKRKVTLAAWHKSQNASVDDFPDTKSSAGTPESKIKNILKNGGVWNADDLQIEDGQVHGYFETGERGARTDHGGGDDGDDWMDSSQIDQEAKPYYNKWKPRMDKMMSDLAKAGFPNLKVGMDYGEKGHVAIQIWGTV